MIDMKKTLLTMTISSALSFTAGANAAVGDFNGNFDFWDATGTLVVGFSNTKTVYGRPTDADIATWEYPAGVTQFPGGALTNAAGFSAGGLNFNNPANTSTGFFTDDTNFSGNQWTGC